MPMRGAWNRQLAGMPLMMLEARGPGHLALSENHAGELVALPMQHGQQMWVKRAPLPYRHGEHPLRLAPDRRLVHHGERG